MAIKKKPVKKLTNGGKKKTKKKTKVRTRKTKADRFLERKLNKDPFKVKRRTRLA
jgi:hypothetical protein